MSGEGELFLPWLFPRMLGGIYFLAFSSLAAQVLGLYGSNGILSLCDYFPELRRELGRRAYCVSPSLFWIRCSDRVLLGSALLGLFLSILLVAGVAPVPLLFLLWLFYLSFVSAGQEFLSYQWDTLLLETGFWTIFLPLVHAAPPLVVFGYRFFLFRFMLSSGLVKLLSGDETWRNLTALCHHYQTQPIPNRIAWHAHHLPKPVQKLCTLVTLIIEVAVPFLALGPQPVRIACFALLVCFQCLIFATGNFGFFNLLTIVLCVPLLDDQVIGSLMALPAPSAGGDTELPLVLDIVFGLFVALNLCQLVALYYRPLWLRRILRVLSPLMVSNHYGLFAMMTTERFEFIIEGSNDGVDWLCYEFRWKPGDRSRPPRQAAPHQPRLDWQMWFAALEPKSVEPWLANLVVRLLEGAPSVLGLFQENPFPEHPPKFIRLSVYRYQIATREKKREDGIWWERTLVGRFKPMTLRPRADQEGTEAVTADETRLTA